MKHRTGSFLKCPRCVLELLAVAFIVLWSLYWNSAA